MAQPPPKTHTHTLASGTATDTMNHCHCTMAPWRAGRRVGHSHMTLPPLLPRRYRRTLPRGLLHSAE
eukprot:12881427-Prorocentrum_lima.AAC.1